MFRETKPCLEKKLGQGAFFNPFLFRTRANANKENPANEAKKVIKREQTNDCELNITPAELQMTPINNTKPYLFKEEC